MPAEYLVLTKCGRRFAWAACDMESLFRDLTFRGYEATFVQPMSEYETDNKDIERELKESA